MNMQTLAANAYSKTTRSVGSPRAVEYQAFQRATAALRKAIDAPDDFVGRAEAVMANSRLWAALAIDLASTGNQLPDDLRGKLLGLAEFSRRHGLKVLETGDGLDDLVEINSAVMTGLRASNAPAADAGER